MKFEVTYESGEYWVRSDASGHHAMVSGLTCSVCDSSYADRSLAVARVDYLAKTHRPGLNFSRSLRLGGN